MNNRTEDAVLTAYHHYNSKAKDSNLTTYWRDTAKDLWVAYKELQAYHKLKNMMFPDIDEDEDND
jgi:hypothetical protein